MSDGTTPLVLREDRGAVALLLLNRPAQRNALRYESWTELSEQLTSVAADPDVRGVVLAGAAGFFCAGGDLKAGPAHGAGPLAPAGRVEHAQRVMEQLKALPVPTVAAVEGAAVGLGWSLALSCDLVVAATDAFFSAPFVARAVVPDGGLAWRLTQQLGRQRAAALLLRGKRLAASDAADVGLVTDLAEPGAAVDRALAVLDELAQADSAAVEMTKRLINSVETAQLAAFHPLELAMATVAQQRSASAASRDRW
ncbi:enoyl-CoA hydratase [Mycolicibacterium novocastrense]|uniref:Enoyl-CoA hydratase/carnithine racemase n=1 Tax=Mycolicibacterium novocastrense TaxID=59813 RepID=A0AAW5SRR2_MYCNV|nr:MULTISPECIES: enoyl-CoA hydratase/isomerase family protein [Mycolicibacterium]KUH64657.1 enoyl-CoA hydratase [Mycolicibacterium novocastrense]KUH64829.1 enoyl-CoA hydratase [Mycolicibacterium novocastrense]KUH76935.1 enoyl-CoA hydratase [Mycolicibacterium novocastrense]MCV7026282.1 enoyl-CoA hydratase/isomerase family protein [Mycolicibacterium novocastrense]CRL77783.1 enoyl-CoA hydratase/carnithine racemase [Mycolicibacterium malmesburyense]